MEEKDISYILSNVRYKGDALLQKSYRDGFPYKAKKNRGKRDKYYKYNANVPIVSREVFDKAERLLSKRGSLYYSGKKDRDTFILTYDNMQRMREAYTEKKTV
ncbi:MAG: recombinase family protein [Eubacteriales bacterium]